METANLSSTSTNLQVMSTLMNWSWQCYLLDYADSQSKLLDMFLSKAIFSQS